MKSIPKLIRRFIGILLLSSLIIIALNFILLIVFTLNQAPNASPWQTAEEVAAGLRQNSDGSCSLPAEMALSLVNDNIWAIYIDVRTMQVIWQTDNLPENIPTTYTVSDIVSLTRGYIDGYPTFPGATKEGLVVLGYPRDSYWKHMWPSWDYHTIASLPRIVLSVLAINILLIFLIYVTANSKLLRSVRPIVNGIQALPSGEPVCIKERGLLSELAANLNRTSEILQSQNYRLRKKETARANWIAGVSHDIRTPLSMVMGYAGQLQDDASLTENSRRKAAAIVRQSRRMKDLINDLNLASKLEYNMQPINPAKQNMVAIVRQVVVDFMNMDILDKYAFSWCTEESLACCTVNADKDLIRRAVGNLIQNSINHNSDGCTIYVSVRQSGDTCTICVEDDGMGASDEELEKLNHTPHYMVCDTNTTEQRHGLGLLIVRQIAESHHGAIEIGHGSYGGFSVKFTLPLWAL